MTMSDYVREVNGTETRLGDFSAYRIDPVPIGTGGFSKVYRATRDGRDYAMKIPMNANIDSDVTIRYEPDDRGRFMEEAERWAMASDSAPDDVVCLTDYNIDPFPWMVMELAACSLKDMILSGEASPKDMVGVLRSLQNIHDTGMVHRDIKPENILKVDGKLKFTDFGLSKVVGSLSRSTAGLKGTPFYMAPEQVSPKRFGNIDVRTDIWQMGIVLYEVLMRKLPFHTKDIAEIGMAITMDGPDFSDAPEKYRKVLSRALCQDKDGRYPTASEFADDLEKAMHLQDGDNPSEEEPAAPGDPYALALAALDAGDPDALKLMTAAAEGGDSRAQSMLGYMHCSGDGAPLDGELGVKWYRAAAAQGDIDAMYNLGLIHAQGRIVKKDLGQAEKWLSEASSKGDADAEKLLKMVRKLK